MAIWGFCSVCRRWFACPGWFDRRQPQPLCPVCFTEPRAIRNAEGPPGPAYENASVPREGGGLSSDGEGDGHGLWGCCPRCSRWFPAHRWFVAIAPLPRCPECKLLPNVLRDDEPAPEERVDGQA